MTPASTNKQQLRNWLLISAGLSLVPILFDLARPLFLPLLYLNTHIHEMCHGLAAIATGGQVSHIKVHADASGVAYTGGGITLAIATAGYVGASAIGCSFILASRSKTSATKFLRWFAITFTILAALWLRGDAVGLVSAVVWVGLLFGVVPRLSADWERFTCQFLGVQQCLYSLQAIWVLQKITVTSNIHNDAKIAESASLIPAAAWAAMWGLLSLVAMALSLRSVWLDRPISRA